MKHEFIRCDIFLQDGSSEGYAYVEFAHIEVAKIAAETMNNYLMYEECLKCKLFVAVLYLRMLFIL